MEEDMSSSQIVAMGFDAEVVHKVIGMVDRNEHKRRQAAPGLRLPTELLEKTADYL